VVRAEVRIGGSVVSLTGCGQLQSRTFGPDQPQPVCKVSSDEQEGPVLDAQVRLTFAG